LLIVEAAAYLSASGDKVESGPGIGQQMAVAECQELKRLVKAGGPTTLRQSDARARETLAKLRARIGLEETVQSLLAIPLKLGNRELGMLSLGEICAEAQSQLTPENIELAASIASQSTVLINRMRMMQALERSHEKLLSLFRVSSDLIAKQSPRLLLRAIVEETRAATEAYCVHLVLIDEQGRAESPISAIPRGYPIEPFTVRSDGISVKVFRNGIPEIINDTASARERLNPVLLRNARAAVCLPLSLQRRRIGVMWIEYDRPRRFSEDDILALQLCVNHAAIAYEQEQERERLKLLREAADALASQTETGKLLDQILLSAQKTLRADGVIFLLFDSERDTFIQDRLLARGIRREAWDRYRSYSPDKGGTAFRLLEQGSVFIDDLHDQPARQKLGENTLSLLAETGARAFQGVALKVGEEKLGVIYAAHHQPRSFGPKERLTATTFARHAFLVLKKTRLHEQVRKTYEAANAVAKITVLGDRQATLNAIVAEVQKATGCDAVVLFEYDRNKGRLMPPTSIGVWDEKQMRASKERPGYPFVDEVLEYDEPRIVEQAARDPAFKDRRFVREERIESFIAISLRATGHKVGAMFINYRQPRRFTADEIDAIELFANQAALAIHYAQFTEELKDTKDKIHSRTILAWNGMADNSWRHIIAGQAAEIANRATLIRELVKRREFDEERIISHLDQIGRLVKSIQDKPITPPLSSEEGASEVNINDLVVERLGQLRQNDRYGNIRFIASPSPPPNLTVRASSEWLRRAFDILVDNAVEAVKPLDPSRRVVTVTAGLQDGFVEIAVADRGCGVRQDVRSNLFKNRIENSKGFGMGLLMALAIVEIYGGRIELRNTGPQGTVMVILLPHHP
jgi:GAF domain-containing protein